MLEALGQIGRSHCSKMALSQLIFVDVLTLLHIHHEWNVSCTVMAESRWPTAELWFSYIMLQFTYTLRNEVFCHCKAKDGFQNPIWTLLIRSLWLNFSYYLHVCLELSFKFINSTQSACISMLTLVLTNDVLQHEVCAPAA